MPLSSQETLNKCIFIVIIPEKVLVRVEVSLFIFAFHCSLILIIMTYCLETGKLIFNN